MGWTNDQATNLTGQAFTYTNTTVEYGAGSAVQVDSGATFTIDGKQPALGVVARNYANTDQPPAGTTAGTPAIAAQVLAVTAQVVQNRIYLISAPALSVRMNVAGQTTGVQFTFTEDGSTPGPTSTLLSSMTVYCPTAGTPQPCPFAATYTRRAVSGTLRVLLSIWQIGTNATVASGGNHGGDPGGIIELVVTDLGVDPGVTP